MQTHDRVTYWQSHLDALNVSDVHRVKQGGLGQLTRITDDSGAGGLELLERGRHDDVTGIV